MPSAFIPPCIPTRAYKVPAGADWVHEIKHDGKNDCASSSSLRLRPRQVQIAFGTKHIAVKASNPLPSSGGNV